MSKKICKCDSPRKQVSEYLNFCCNDCGGIVINSVSLAQHLLQCGDIGLSDYVDFIGKTEPRQPEKKFYKYVNRGGVPARVECSEEEWLEIQRAKLADEFCDETNELSWERAVEIGKMWEAAKPKMNFIDLNTPMIFGTAGEIPEGDWKKLWNATGIPEEKIGSTLVIFDEYADWTPRTETVPIEDVFKK